MEPIILSIDQVFGTVPENKIMSFKKDVQKHIDALYQKTGKGNDFLGWVDLPAKTTDHQLKEIHEVANELRNKIDVLVVIGIGGSYLGAKSVIDILSHNFNALLVNRKNPVVLYAGQNIGEDYLFELLEVLENYKYGITVISKSGTTTEPAIAFRLLRHHLETKYGKNEARKRIVAITDEKKGALLNLAKKEGYKTFFIPHDVGGRYSVLTPVGLFPIAVAGGNIFAIIKGAQHIMELTGPKIPFEENPAALYAATRNSLYINGKILEIMVNFTPRMHNFSEWWKQLYGESEGKQGKGIFPVSVDFTTDLHSMGQYIQDGQRNIFETVLSVSESRNSLAIPYENDDADGLNFISYKPLSYVNKMAQLGTLLAHVDGGVPNILIEIPKLNENYIGQLIYMFEMACGISGYMLDVNPFDQPGVEAYKHNMFALLGKPGYEETSEIIRNRIDKMS
ncbi:MAG: glucose-6-phosphate isomerase [Bacteroidetes bacterium CG23_combo_of_CG06-09_8_20_14_all_32_9]|nr:MAG: glucose-6-phosphate isomerase [Bacteroidetes bacterium CG23_combo_of_CG06-09_8_20_14_all_32_9]